MALRPISYSTRPSNSKWTDFGIVMGDGSRYKLELETYLNEPDWGFFWDCALAWSLWHGFQFGRNCVWVGLWLQWMRVLTDRRFDELDTSRRSNMYVHVLTYIDFCDSLQSSDVSYNMHHAYKLSNEVLLGHWTKRGDISVIIRKWKWHYVRPNCAVKIILR